MLDEKGKYSFSMKEEWYGVDLDGTLAYLEPKNFPMIGKPIISILSKVTELLRLNKRVKIFTARAQQDIEVRRIRRWLREVELPENLEISNTKDYLCKQIWDDRARQVISNTGYFVDDDVTASIEEMKREFEEEKKK